MTKLSPQATEASERGLTIASDVTTSDDGVPTRYFYVRDQGLFDNGEWVSLGEGGIRRVLEDVYPCRVVKVRPLSVEREYAVTTRAES